MCQSPWQLCPWEIRVFSQEFGVCRSCFQNFLGSGCSGTAVRNLGRPQKLWRTWHTWLRPQERAQRCIHGLPSLVRPALEVQNRGAGSGLPSGPAAAVAVVRMKHKPKCPNGSEQAPTELGAQTAGRRAAWQVPAGSGRASGGDRRTCHSPVSMSLANAT